MSTLDQLRTWLSDHDPGGFERCRAVQLGIGVSLSILLAIFTMDAFLPQKELDAGLSIRSPLFAAMATVMLLMTVAEAGRRAEAVELGHFAAIILTVIGATALLGTLGLTSRPEHAKLLIPPLAFASLFLRRYGPGGRRYGVLLFLSGFITLISAPSGEIGLWLLLAAIQGIAVASLVRLALWRPDIVHVLSDAQQRFTSGVRQQLLHLSGGQRSARADPDIATLRQRLRLTSLIASTHSPEDMAALEEMRAVAYRQDLLLRVIEEDLSRLSSAATADISTRMTLDHLRETAHGAAPEDDKQRSHRLRNRLIDDPALSDPDRIVLLHIMAAANRIGSLLARQSANTSRNSAQLTDKGAVSKAPLPGLSGAPTRIALQGLVAVTITTIADLFGHIDHGYWASLTALMVIGNSFGETFNRAKARLVGTLVGVLLGIGAAFTLTDHYILMALIVCAAMIAVITRRDRYDISSGCMGFAVIIVLHLFAGLGLGSMTARIYETAFGGAVALVTARFLLPVFAARDVESAIMMLLGKAQDSYASWWPHDPVRQAVSSRDVTAAFKALLAQIPQVTGELALGRGRTSEVLQLISAMDALTDHLSLAEEAATRIDEHADGIHDDIDPAHEAAFAARQRTLESFDKLRLPVSPREDRTARDDPGHSLDDRLHRAMQEIRDHPERQRLILNVFEYSFFSTLLRRDLSEISDHLAPA